MTFALFQMDQIMNLESRYAIESQINTDSLSGMILRVKLYDRSLKTAIRDFIARENLRLQDMTLDDWCIDYKIACSQPHYATLLEQMLRQAAQD